MILIDQLYSGTVVVLQLEHNHRHRTPVTTTPTLNVLIHMRNVLIPTQQGIHMPTETHMPQEAINPLLNVPRPDQEDTPTNRKTVTETLSSEIDLPLCKLMPMDVHEVPMAAELNPNPTVTMNTNNKLKTMTMMSKR